MSNLLSFPAQPARPLVVRTRFEITEELLALAALKHQLSTATIADDCQRLIRAQMTVLEERIPYGDLYDRFGDDGDNVLNMAMDAAAWMVGDEDGPMSDHWRKVAHEHAFTSTAIPV